MWMSSAMQTSATLSLSTNYSFTFSTIFSGRFLNSYLYGIIFRWNNLTILTKKIMILVKIHELLAKMSFREICYGINNMQIVV